MKSFMGCLFTGSFSSRSVNSCRSSKKTSVFKMSLSPRPQSPPSSSPRTLKRKWGVQQPSTLANNRLSSSAEIMKPTVSEPPSINDQCICSQSGYSELSVGNGVTSNNNNNNDNNKNNQEDEVLEMIDFVNQKQQQLVCVADSGSSINNTKPATVYAEKPVFVLQNECDYPNLSVSRPPTPSTPNKQPIEGSQQVECDYVSSMSYPLTPPTTVKQQIEKVQQIEGDNVSPFSCPLILSIPVEQQNDSIQQTEGDIISSMPCPLTLSTTAEQQIERVQQIESENVSSISCPLTMSISIEQQIENEQQIKSDPVLSISSLLSLSIVVEQPMAAKKSVMTEVLANHDKVSPVLSPQFPLMTSTTDDEKQVILKVVSPSPQPKDDNKSLVQSNMGKNQTNSMVIYVMGIIFSSQQSEYLYN